MSCVETKGFNLVSRFFLCMFMICCQEESVACQQLPRFQQLFKASCLPKTPSRTDAVQGDMYAPSKTRPLSIVNTGNRIIANAYRLMMEPIIGMWVSDMQRGFLNGSPFRGLARNECSGFIPTLGVPCVKSKICT